MAIVTLTTDFGTADGYVGEMKGVLLSRVPSAILVDVTHSVEPGDLEGGAWVLFRIWSRYPAGTVHLVVIDPGVGGERRAVAARAAGRWFVGPDNGLVTLVARRAALEDVWCLDPGRAGLPEISDTFHGRDLFAPAAAHLAAGGDPEGLGPRVDAASLVRLAVPEPVREGETIHGQVVHVDRFGNLITNVPAEWLPERPAVEIMGAAIRVLGRSFADVGRGELVLIRGSAGTLEIAARDASAAVHLGVGRGEPLSVRPAE